MVAMEGSRHISGAGGARQFHRAGDERRGASRWEERSNNSLDSGGDRQRYTGPDPLPARGDYGPLARRNRSASCSSRSFASARARARIRSTSGFSFGSPQQKAAASCVTTQVWLPPLFSMATFSSPRGGVPTGVGINRSVVVPSPTSPREFRPQQYDWPAVVTPQLVANPALIVANCKPFCTATGLSCASLVPSPC